MKVIPNDDEMEQHLLDYLPRWPSGLKRDCYYARGLGSDSQVERKVLLGFSIKYSVAARS